MIQKNKEDKEKNKGGSFSGRTLVSKTSDVGSTPAPPALTERQIEIQKKRITKLADKWLGILGLRHWRIYFVFEKEKEDRNTRYNPGELKIVGDEWDIVMCTQVDPYYLEAHITVYLPTIKDFDDDEVEESFLHECCHIMVALISRNKKEKEEELVVTSLARAIKNSYDTNKNGSRKINTRRSINKGNLTHSLSA